MEYYLLIDFGTTRVKAALVDLGTGVFSHISEYPHLENCCAEPYRHELDPVRLAAQFDEICGTYSRITDNGLMGVLISSQMHGFALLDSNNKPISNYVTWKDERSLIEFDGKTSFLTLSEEAGSSFRAITGMKPRPCFPVANLLHLARTKQLPSWCKVVTLPELLCSFYDECTNFVHPTMIAGLALYNIYKNKIDDSLLELITGYSGNPIRFNDVADEQQISGYYSHGGRKVPIYVGIGDHQCNVLGAGNQLRNTISINIGTGSQVSVIGGTSDSTDVEERPYFCGDLLSTITHIPAGRALAAHAKFVSSIAGREDVFWEALQSLDADDVLNVKLDFGLRMFNSAWRYQNGGYIKNMEEDSWNLKTYTAGLLKGLCLQYRDAVGEINLSGDIKECVLSGGIPRHLPQLVDILSQLLNRKITIRDGMEEPLLGLRALALMASGKVRSYQQAYSHFCEK